MPDIRYRGNPLNWSVAKEKGTGRVGRLVSGAGNRVMVVKQCNKTFHPGIQNNTSVPGIV
jgi:hypothetical protein